MGALIPIGDRVVRGFDGAIGTVEQSSIYNGRPLYGVRLDQDGEIWQGNDLAWTALPTPSPNCDHEPNGWDCDRYTECPSY